MQATKLGIIRPHCSSHHVQRSPLACLLPVKHADWCPASGTGRTAASPAHERPLYDEGTRRGDDWPQASFFFYAGAVFFRQLGQRPCCSSGNHHRHRHAWLCSHLYRDGRRLAIPQIFETVAGNVGIATTTPAAKLDVKGTGDVRDTLTLFPKLTHPALSVKEPPSQSAALEK